MDFIDFVLQSGWQTAVIALLSIMITGVVKAIFKKKFVAIGADLSKTIYQVVVTVSVFGLTALWMAVRGPWFDFVGPVFSLTGWGAESALSYSAAQVMYPIYENYHIRDFVELAVKVISKRGDV